METIHACVCLQVRAHYCLVVHTIIVAAAVVASCRLGLPLVHVFRRYCLTFLMSVAVASVLELQSRKAFLDAYSGHGADDGLSGQCSYTKEDKEL